LECACCAARQAALRPLLRTKSGVHEVASPNAPRDHEAAGNTVAVADGDGVRRTYIVRTAAALLSSHGYTSTSIREVAAAVGLSKPGLYHYFPTKEAILEEIAEGA